MSPEVLVCPALSGGTTSERRAHLTFATVCTLLFVATAALTIMWCASMSGVHSMHMPGGWTMSMVWMRMPGQTWPESAASFTGMWTVMMIAMMLPSIAPALWRYHQAAGDIGHKTWLTTLAGAGYFIVWTVLGTAVFVLGVALAELEMRQPELARAVPIAAGVVVLIAGVVQFTAFKAHRLRCCRQSPEARPAQAAHAGAAWRIGLWLGIQCASCCGNLMLILLIFGVMDLRAMAVLTLAITGERLAPKSHVVARAIGVVSVAAGLFMITRSAGLE